MGKGVSALNALNAIYAINAIYAFYAIYALCAFYAINALQSGAVVVVVGQDGGVVQSPSAVAALWRDERSKVQSRPRPGFDAVEGVEVVL